MRAAHEANCERKRDSRHGQSRSPGGKKQPARSGSAGDARAHTRKEISGHFRICAGVESGVQRRKERQFRFERGAAGGTPIGVGAHFARQLGAGGE
jgi:hypothetical protein